MMVGLGSGVGVGVLVGKAACEDLDWGPQLLFQQMAWEWGIPRQEYEWRP